ncbi:MAG: C10 family peptidase [Bacteroidales bacterium]|nr:C10 family peptidase [Bacteroidales bacterium]
MKTINKIYMLISATLIMHTMVFGQMVSIIEAETIAKNWIEVIKDETGSWGEYSHAEIEPLQEFTSNERILGYFCNVNPNGYIIISLRRELAPVKAYSTKSQMDPDLDQGISDLIKTGMLRILDIIESQLGRLEEVNPSDLNNLVEINYTQAWTEVYNYIPGKWIDQNKQNKNGKDDYVEGEILLGEMDWHQRLPFNGHCPLDNCTHSNGHTLVGCVATAGSQIMNYWKWPPYGVGSPYGDFYDWPNMPDEPTTSSPPEVQYAVAELCSEVGIAVGMDWGCDGSSAHTYNMEDVFEDHYRYSTTCVRADRSDYTATEWFDIIKAQINLNRPIQYRILAHSIVVDGWQEIGSPAIKEYHANYGWDGSSIRDIWYTLDALYYPEGGTIDDEYIVANIVPVTAVGNVVYGPYLFQSFPYRYFDRDAIGSNAYFGEGQFLQFLPGITVTGISSDEPIKFHSTNSLPLRLFTRGNLINGVQISGGDIELKNYGSIKFH